MSLGAVGGVLLKTWWDTLVVRRFAGWTAMKPVLHFRNSAGRVHLLSPATLVQVPGMGTGTCRNRHSRCHCLAVVGDSSGGNGYSQTKTVGSRHRSRARRDRGCSRGDASESKLAHASWRSK